MRYRSCDNCQWQDTSQCCSSNICKSFSPIIEEIDDEEMFQMVESARTEYANAYRSYINEADNYFNFSKYQKCV